MKCKTCSKQITGRGKTGLCLSHANQKVMLESWKNKPEVMGMTGKHQSKNMKKKMHERFLGDKSTSWKGENISYSGLHNWIHRKYGNATKCEECRSTKNIQWANKTGKYLRDRTDWLQLCPSCHWFQDNQNHSKKRFICNSQKRMVCPLVNTEQ